MAISLCPTEPCKTPNCPIVDIRDDCVFIGEDDNACTLTHEQFNILKEKIKNNEI